MYRSYGSCGCHTGRDIGGSFYADAESSAGYDYYLCDDGFYGEGMLIFCVGVNLLWEKKLKVANMLPAIVIAVICAFLGL